MAKLVVCFFFLLGFPSRFETKRKNIMIITKEEGKDAVFKYVSSANKSFGYLHIGEKKDGLFDPTPNLLVVDVAKKNSYSKVANTSYTGRLTYEGSPKDGFFLIKLENVQITDSRTFRATFSEVGPGNETRLVVRDFKLQVVPSVNHTEPSTTRLAFGTSPDDSLPSVNHTVTSTRPPLNTGPNVTYTNGNKLYWLFILVLIPLCMILCYVYWFIKKKKKENHQQQAETNIEEGEYHALSMKKSPNITQEDQKEHEDLIEHVDGLGGHTEEV